jgi:DNA-directed RNA polymerase specialized sigma subunit
MAESLEEVMKEQKKGVTFPSYDAWQAEPSPQNMRTVITEMNPVIESAVKQYGGTRPSPTVYHRARILAADAVRSYNPKKGANLKTHIFNQLRRLQRMTPEIVDPLSPPERFRRQQMEIQNASTELEDILNREPTDEEISDLTDIPLNRVIKVRSRMRARIPLSAYEDASDDDDADVPDIVGDEYSDYDDWMDAVYSDLGPTDRLIMMYRTGYRGSDILTNEAIARKLKISPSAVSQRASRIQKKLDNFRG